MKKIAFVFLEEPKIEPLGVLYLAAVAKKCGCEVGYFSQHTHQSLELYEFKPDYVCYSIITGNQERFKQVDESLKKFLLPFESIAGGPHVSFFPEDCGWADHVCIGEGENYLANLLTETQGSFFHDIDALPWPVRPFNSPVGHFISSRGCPYDCSYCYNSKWQAGNFLPKVRVRNVQDVVAEIDAINSNFFYFQDDCFGTDIKWLREFTELYNNSIPYHCHVRTELITPERVELLRKSGCRSVHMAIETADEKTRRDLLNRKMTNNQIIKAVGLLHDARIAIMTQNIIGLPGSYIGDDLKTLEFNIELQPAYAWCSIYQPYPGTKLADYCLRNKLWDGDVSKIGASFFDTSQLNFTPEHITQLEVLQKTFATCVNRGRTTEVNSLSDFAGRKVELREIYDYQRHEGDIKLFGKEIVDLWK